MAFLLEIAMYVATGTPAVRERLERFQWLPLWMTLSVVPPYLVYALGTGRFSAINLIVIVALAGTVSYWYILLPKRLLVDLLLLAFLAAIYLLKVFQDLYPSPMPRMYAGELGKLMWIRLGMLAVLSLRQMGGIGFGFLPRKEDWRVGFRFYIYFLPAGIALALLLNFLRPEPAPITWKLAGLALATFVGSLWVLAAMEEIFFRGLLQQILTRKMGGAVQGLIAASVVFGLVHLPYRDFPNWRFALLAGLAGLFYGAAFQKARSVRASMVTHALVVTTWRVFLQ